jgi:hypothetical protein
MVMVNLPKQLPWLTVRDGSYSTGRCLASGTFQQRSEEETISKGLKVVKLLLEANPDTIKTQGQSGAAFNFAVAGRVDGAGRLAFVKLPLDTSPHPSTLNARDQSGMTALQACSERPRGLQLES